jgi:nitrite reductase/ring-hydroxylating ferredoxin subunit
MAWTPAARRSAFDASPVIGAVCDGHRVAVYRLDGEYFATSDICPHAGGALSSGCVVDRFIECPVHYALFDIRTGAPDGAVTARHVKTYHTRVVGDEILVDLDA